MHMWPCAKKKKCVPLSKRDVDPWVSGLQPVINKGAIEPIRGEARRVKGEERRGFVKEGRKMIRPK